MIPVMRPALGEEEALAAAEAVRSGWVAQGPRVAAFEREFAAAVGAGEGVAGASCTARVRPPPRLPHPGPRDPGLRPPPSLLSPPHAVPAVRPPPRVAA